jgi:hypothetical protein
VSATPPASEGAGAGAVALLGLHPRRDRSFLDDFHLHRISGELRAAGIASDVVVAHLPPGAGRDGPELSALVGALRAYATIVYERVWSAEIPRWLREALPGATLVRLGGAHDLPGAPADHVARGADEALQLLGRLAGRALPPLDAAYRPNLNPVYVTPEARPVDPSLPLFGAEGCPHRADPRANPAYAGVALPADVARGCAFCTSGGDPERRAPEEVLASVLEQLRVLRAGAPEVRRLVLRDQRPFGWLEPLVARAAAEGLGPFTLLLQSRADWFLRSGPAFAAALRAAEGTGIRLAPFLVGIESFSQPELDRFNKGVEVATLVAFLRELRAWKAAHPEALDLSQGAYGFILFTPWTTLDDLEENLRWIRATRFDELRRHFLLSRLRLYPRTALHHLAARDGLLAAGEGPAADDPSARYGYLPSPPWRFRDPRVARIAALAPELVGGRAGEDEPALLEALLAAVRGAARPEDVGPDDVVRLLGGGVAATRGREAELASALVGARDLPVELPGSGGLRLLGVEAREEAFVLRIGREVPSVRLRLRRTAAGFAVAVEAADGDGEHADRVAVAEIADRLARISPRRWQAARDAAREHEGRPVSRSPGFDAETAALVARLKPALRISAADAEADGVAARLEALGAHVVRAPGFVRTEGRRLTLLYASFDLALAEELRAAEAPTLALPRPRDPARLIRRVGALLGYPPCCVDAFTAMLEACDARPRDPTAESYRCAAAAWVPRPHAHLNTLLRAARVHLVSHEPCRFDCRPSLDYAGACLRELGRADAGRARELERALATAVVVAPTGARALVEVDPGPPRRIASARRPWGSSDPADAALARAIAGAEVGPEGAVATGATPAPLLLDFRPT